MNGAWRIGAAFAASIPWAAAPAEVRADAVCDGLFDCSAFEPGQVIGIAIFAMLFGAAVACLVFVRRRRSDDGPLSVIHGANWPAFVTRRDGTLVGANAAMRRLSPSGRSAHELIEPVLGLGASEIYRLSRLAMRNGAAMSTYRDNAAQGLAALSVHAATKAHLVWQIVDESRLDALFPDAGLLGHDGAPFCYARFSAMDPPVTNDLFRHYFSKDALDLLHEQLDAGVLAPGRLALPTAEGAQRTALCGTRVGRTVSGDVHEVFLFVPDGETKSQISAAETLDAIPVSLVHLDIEGRVLWANAQARETLGEGFERGCALGEVLQPLGRSLDSLLREVQSGKDSGRSEMVRLGDGEFDRFAQVSLTRMTLEGQPSLIAVLTDASELRQLEDKFAQSQKMEAVGKLAGGVAHDFNNVLTAISGNCDLLLLRKDASHPDFSDLTQIRQNANRAAALVRQLLAFSRKQTLQPRLLSVQDVVTDTLYLLDRLIGETITLSLDHGRELGSVRADNQQLEQALMNLVVNARDAMPDGGMITISTRNRKLDAEEGFPGVSVPPGDYVEIAVSDNGSGIDPKVIDKVFDPFFTTKSQGEGTGLGLSTVYGIVKQSGGYIYVENIAGGGARFTTLLPRAYPEPVSIAEVREKAVSKSTDLTGQGAVMLVEDEAPVRSFASRALKLRGYRVIEADSAEAAMKLLKGGVEDIDVLVSDVVMPGMDGPTFAGEARKLRPDLRVVFISGYAEDSFRRNQHGDDFLFLSKPFSLNELTATVKVAMDGAQRRA